MYDDRDDKEMDYLLTLWWLAEEKEKIDESDSSLTSGTVALGIIAFCFAIFKGFIETIISNFIECLPIILIAGMIAILIGFLISLFKRHKLASVVFLIVLSILLILYGTFVK